MKIAKYIIPIMILCVAIVGCEQPCPPIETLAPVEKLVGDYNANAEKVPRLWAKAKIEISGVRNGLPFKFGSVSPLADPNGLLILLKNNNPLGPQDCVLIFRESGKELARFGVSTKDNAYYTWVIPAESCLMGNLQLAGSPDAKIQLDPLGLQSMLGVCALPKTQNAIPCVAQRVQTEKPYAQILCFMDHTLSTIGKGPVVFKRDLYFRWQLDPKDPSKLLPRELFMVKYFDAKGVEVMTAELGDYKPIELEDVDNENTGRPGMPTKMTITWPGRNEKIRIVLEKMTTADKVDPAVFEFWGRLPDSMKNKVKKVD